MGQDVGNREPLVYRITFPEELQPLFAETLSEIEADASEIDGPGRESQLQFDPLSATVGLYVGNLVLGAVAGVTVDKVLTAFIDRIRKRGKQADGVTITVTTPDAREVQILPGDAKQVIVDLAKLTNPE